MKQIKRMLAVILALVLVLSCLGTAFAVDAPRADGGKIRGISDRKENDKGYKDKLPSDILGGRYAPNDTVRAIVVLNGTPEADVAERSSERAVSQRAKLMGEHQKIFAAMEGIRYELLSEYTALLDGFACKVAYRDLKKIAAIDGVASVHIANSYAIPSVQKEKATRMSMANEITGNAYTNYAGDGAVVAVLDTGLRTTHEAFRTYGDIKLTETMKRSDLNKVETAAKYLSAKIPFAYDYADGDDDVSDQDGHGTHVAGIIGGLVVEEDGAVSFSGGAPLAQLLIMKIFSDAGGGTSSDIYFNALEDAYKLGVDVVNMSIGAQNGFTYDAELETEVFGNIYKRMADAGIVMCVAAGNEGSMAANSSLGYIGPEYQDYGVVGSPSTYEGNTSVASLENAAYPSYVISVGEDVFAFNDSSEESLWLTAFGGRTDLDYVVVYNAANPEDVSFGVPEDFAAADVRNKIAVISRGGITFEEKVENAAAAGAIGCIVVNNEAGVIGMQIETYEIPAVSLLWDAMDYLVAGNGKLSVPAEKIMVENPQAFHMSDFSSWGTTPDLTIDPAITSVGGNVYSSVNTEDNAYDVYSGTSMACPNAAATFANVLCDLKDKGITDKAERAEKAKSLLETSGSLCLDADGYLYSVRKQGAGLINSVQAKYLHDNGAYITNPLHELGDDPAKTGKFSFKLELKNDTDNSVTYDADAIAMYDYILKDAQYDITYNALASDYLLDTEISLEGMDPGTCYTKQFSDCIEEWYHEYVDYVCYSGMMNGIGNGKFDPEGALTRAMAVTVLYRLSNENYEGVTSFEDVPKDSWYTEAVAWAENAGVVKGTTATTFSPDEKITREQITTILWRYIGEPEANLSNLDIFPDSQKTSEYAKTAMAFAIENALINGSDGMLLPLDYTTRAQFAAIMTRYTGNYYDCSRGELVIPAHSTREVTVNINLNNDKAYLDELFENGAFIEGYVDFFNAECSTHATFLAFYGDWTKGPALEQADTKDLIEAAIFLNTQYPDGSELTYAELGYGPLDLIDCYTKPNVAYTAVMDQGEPIGLVWYLGDNLYEYIDYNEKHNAFTTAETNAHSASANGIYMEPAVLRNCDHLIMTVSNAETGEVYFVDDTTYLPKDYFDQENGWTSNGVFYWDGTNADGEFVPTGTVAHVRFDAVLPYRETEVKDVWSYDVMVDYTAPEILSTNYDAANKTLTVTAKDENYLQAICLYNSKDKLLDVAAFSGDHAGEDFTATFDLTAFIEQGEELVYVSAVDYATNETFDATVEVYDVPHFYVPSAYSEFEGEFAICGYNYDYVEEDFISKEPIIMDANGNELDGTALTDVTLEAYKMTTAREDIVFKFTMLDENVFSIQNKDGKYLAAVDGEIAFVDELTLNAVWIVFTDDYGEYVYIYNYDNTNLTLLYDDVNGEFKLFDDSVAIGSDEYGDYYPSECYCIWLYIRETGGVTINYVDLT